MYVTRFLLCLSALLITVNTSAQTVSGEPVPSAYGVVDSLPVTPAFAAAPFAVEQTTPQDSSRFSDGSIRLAQSSDFANSAATVPIHRQPSACEASERGIFQGLDLDSYWLPRLEDDSLGHSTFGATLKLGVPPQFVAGLPMLVKPRWGLHLLDGPSGTDVPPRLHDLELGFGTYQQINARWLFVGELNVGVYGDDHSLDASDALRVSGSAVGIYTTDTNWKWALGVAYLNRNDVSVLPVVGLIYDQGAVKYELMFPRPRIVWRLPSTTNCLERSFYLAGELGGGAWAVQRTSGATDTLNLASYGALLGYEQKTVGGWSRRYEFGYLFGRELEYEKSGEKITLDDSLIARIGLSY